MDPVFYRIEVKRSAAKEIRSIRNQALQARIMARIGRLAEQLRPKGCEKLTAKHAWRVRVGRYRIVYTINDSLITVVVIKVAHRRDVYRKK